MQGRAEGAAVIVHNFGIFVNGWLPYQHTVFWDVLKLGVLLIKYVNLLLV